MSVLHLLDLSTLSSKKINGFFALEQEVYLLDFEDSLHGGDNVYH